MCISGRALSGVTDFDKKKAVEKLHTFNGFLISKLSIIHYQLPQTPFHLIAQPTDLVIFTTTGFPANKLFTASSM